NPPAADGRKVVVTDTDHYAPPDRADALWAWKSFLRGHHPILMDFGIIAGANPPDPAASSPGIPPYQAFEPARYAMGDTLHYAQKMDLLTMEPRGDLSSTGYVLAHPGKEYLVLQPNASAEAWTLDLAAGTYTVEWYNVHSRDTKDAPNVTVARTTTTRFSAPFDIAAPAVLYLRQER
ncbi:MAG TPA: hypothetical protein VM536_17370, partial [Chloroflexia bacterium]|nr:hypothetical protein [Chloroflexia bacterium]